MQRSAASQLGAQRVGRTGLGQKHLRDRQGLRHARAIGTNRNGDANRGGRVGPNPLQQGDRIAAGQLQID
jgi:hypothetical protein